MTRANFLRLPARYNARRCGEVAEWFKAPVLKTDEGESPPWVRIPPSPPLQKGPTRGLFCSGGEGGVHEPAGSTNRQDCRFGRTSEASAPAGSEQPQGCSDQSHPKAWSGRTLDRCLAACVDPMISNTGVYGATPGRRAFAGSGIRFRAMVAAEERTCHALSAIAA